MGGALNMDQDFDLNDALAHVFGPPSELMPGVLAFGPRKFLSDSPRGAMRRPRPGFRLGQLIYHRLMGDYFGIPLCCQMQWIYEMVWLNPCDNCVPDRIKLMRPIPKRFDYVPCDKCYADHRKQFPRRNKTH